MNPTLRLLISDLYPGALAPEHRADLEKSGLADETLQRHKIRSVPPSMIERLLGLDAPKVLSAYIIPYPSSAGGWLDHVRLRIFPPYEDTKGRTVKYLGPTGMPPRIYIPIATIPALTASAPLWVCEGAKKSLVAAQLGLPAIGFEGIEAWHRAGSRELLPDFDHAHLQDRLVELAPDGDVQTNSNVRRGAERFAAALRDRGARVRLVRLPEEIAA